jgi:LAS superfamily LD-carboxypeptidase LdcB
MDLLLGLNQNNLVKIPNSKLLIHQDALKSFNQLQAAAKENGIDLRLTSSFRSFSHQKEIWNKKASGQRPLLNNLGEEVNFEDLSHEEVLFSILKWSALPGFSRHHWGTDIDVYDNLALPSKDYQVQLTPQEVSDKGIFSKLHKWLDEVIESDDSFGFFRPYQQDLGGVAPEKWHLSYRPISENLISEITEDFFLKTLERNEYDDLLLLDNVKENSSRILQDYILNISY